MPTQFDLILRNATVVDGTGAARFQADVALQGDLIARIGSLNGAAAKREIDASGRIVAPGFIDAHTHDDRLLLSAPDLTPKISQGVTTVVTGNCGISLAPPVKTPVPPLDLIDADGTWFRYARFADYLAALDAQPASVNAACLIGHSTLRVATMSDLERPATATETACMQALAREALAAGAIGISTGLYYAPAAAATTEEVIEVCAPLRELQRLYVTHMRDEADDVLTSLDESFRIGRELGVPIVISHHKVVGAKNYGRSEETLAHIERQLAKQAIGLDCYPYHASSTVLSAARLDSASRILVTWSKPHPECAGQELAHIAQRWQIAQTEAVARLQPAGAIYFSMDEADVQRILRFDTTMIGSDGLPHDAMPHPRLWGTFPRVLGHYSRDLGLFSLETAVHKMTGLPASKFALHQRGILREGYAADITMFDAASIGDSATFADPMRAARGIDTVIVNGNVVWRDGVHTGARPGRVLRPSNGS